MSRVASAVFRTSECRCGFALMFAEERLHAKRHLPVSWLKQFENDIYCSATSCLCCKARETHDTQSGPALVRTLHALFSSLFGHPGSTKTDQLTKPCKLLPSGFIWVRLCCTQTLVLCPRRRIIECKHQSRSLGQKSWTWLTGLYCLLRFQPFRQKQVVLASELILQGQTWRRARRYIKINLLQAFFLQGQ